MIIFDFKCSECGESYEAGVKNSDSTPEECRICGSDAPQKKLITGVGCTYAKSNDQPQSQTDLANYLGSGKYLPGYKPSFAR